MPRFFAVGALGTDLTGQGQTATRRVHLFDGQSFEGWEGDTQAVWRIEKRALVGGSLAAPLPHNEFLCTTRSYTNFDLRLKVKLVGSGFVNGGVQFRSRRIADPPYEVSGYQADMGDTYWGGLYDEARRNAFLAQPDPAAVAQVLRPNDWNRYQIRCEGRRIRIWLNDLPTVDYTESDPGIPSSGIIGLQIHGGAQAEASYRHITLRELP